jgi:hypothetical protein
VGGDAGVLVGEARPVLASSFASVSHLTCFCSTAGLGPAGKASSSKRRWRGWGFPGRA